MFNSFKSLEKNKSDYLFKSQETENLVNFISGDLSLTVQFVKSLGEKKIDYFLNHKRENLVNLISESREGTFLLLFNSFKSLGKNKFDYLLNHKRENLVYLISESRAGTFYPLRASMKIVTYYATINLFIHQYFRSLME